jgi:SpoVK/Ycf46/Vps4 family AAA+-type ATPase
VSQTENAIQNIILEELERFEGIFFATTNLVINLDKAFERRFLFKIQYSLPDENVKTKIWKDKMPQLSVNDCSNLAELFSFSGGQIENIVRKYEVQKILNGMMLL